MMEETRKVEGYGRCPYCNSDQYVRDFDDLSDDNAFFNCKCECGKIFKETFVLMFQDWDK